MSSFIRVLGLTSLTLAGVHGQSAFAQCTTNPVFQADTSRPALNGRLVYHSYNSYGDGSSKLYLFDFRSNVFSTLSSKWAITDPMNAQFSPDGLWITFMGIQNNQWNVFLWQLGSAGQPINITAALGAHRNEDPKFSADGKRIVFKQDGDIKIANLNFTLSPPVISSVQSVTSDGMKVEESMPFLSPSGKYVIFTRGAGASFDIYRTNLVTNVTDTVAGTAGVAEYYPVYRDSSTIFYTRWVSAANANDQIYMYVPNLNSRTQLKLNDCASNNSDTAPVDEDLIIFSGTREGRYKLYLGDVTTGYVWKLDAPGVNNAPYNVLGASYSNRR